jgi:hypothetical protein
LKSIGLTKSDSQRAQMVATHTDLIPKIVEEATEAETDL